MVKLYVVMLAVLTQMTVIAVIPVGTEKIVVIFAHE